MYNCASAGGNRDYGDTVVDDFYFPVSPSLLPSHRCKGGDENANKFARKTNQPFDSALPISKLLSLQLMS